MKLLPILNLILGELGVGTALFVCLQQTGEIRKSFFSFQSWLVATCFLFMSITDSGNRFFASPYFPSVVFAAFAAIHFSAERFSWGKKTLLLSAILGSVFLLHQIWITPSRSGSRFLAIENWVAGTFLFGWINGSMILGHWYLLMKGLSFSHFQRATIQLLWAIAIRAAGFAAASLWIHFVRSPSESLFLPPTTDFLFFSMRILWGIILPVIIGFMAWRCARGCSNLAGTGLLYLGEIAILIGEILSGYLGI